jgi:hypothetical protein
MALEGRRFRRRKKEDVFVEGYFIDHANVSTPGFNLTDETFHLYGKDSPELDVLHNFGTLTIGVLDKYTNNAILDLICGQDPGNLLPHRYQVDDLTAVHVWANVKDTKNTKYVKSWFMGGWAPGMPMPSGNPEAKAEVTITGNGHLPEQFQGAFVMMKKVVSGAAVAMGVTPLLVPGSGTPGNYAISVKAINDLTPGGGIFDQEEVPVNSSMVTSTGLVVAPAITALLTQLQAFTHVAVYYLSSGSGVYPQAGATPDRLRT